MSSARRAHVALVVVGALFVVFLINWIAVSIHITDLNRQASVEMKRGGNADDALEHRADAEDFEGTRTAFEVLTLIAGATLICGTTFSILRRLPRP